MVMLIIKLKHALWVGQFTRVSVPKPCIVSLMFARFITVFFHDLTMQDTVSLMDFQ